MSHPRRPSGRLPHRLLLAGVCGLVALVPAPAAAAEAADSRPVRLTPDGGLFRLVRVTAPDGSVRLEMTNLDSEGNRLGGELTEADRIRIWGERPAPAAPAAPVEAGPGPAPVVVNVYPQGADSGTIPGGLHGGFIPAYWQPIDGVDGDRHGRHHGRGGHRPNPTWHSAADPYGSAINVKPYTRGTARQRNARAFRRN